MHLKRQEISKKWPIPRKGTAYVVRPVSNLKDSVPILLALRDILKVAQNRKEVKKAIHDKIILINTKPARDDKNYIMLFDSICLIPSNKNYRLELNEIGKFALNEIKETEAGKKISKITGKKVLAGKKIQLNLSDGANYLSNIKCNINDSVLIDLKNKKIEKCLPLKENANVVVIAGKHAGKKGIIEKLKEERKMAKLNIGKDSINVLIKQMMVVE